MSEVQTLNVYQRRASRFAVYPQGSDYPVLGLGEEAGEVTGLFAKAVRKGTPVPLDKLRKELGDVLWNVAQIATDHGMDLSDIANFNLKKLDDRQARGVIVGEGDDR